MGSIRQLAVGLLLCAAACRPVSCQIELQPSASNQTIAPSRFWPPFQAVWSLYGKLQVEFLEKAAAWSGRYNISGAFPHEKLVPLLPATMEEVVVGKGYTLETHTVTTSDGYILTIHRIPHGRYRHAAKGQKPVVLLQHGITLASNCFAALRANESMAFILADAGFDVWMSNSRGNTFSRNHTTLNPDVDVPFWYISMDEQALIDIPTQIDYVLAHTGAPKLGFVGHSQGATLINMLLSTREEYNDKVAVAVQLGPLGAIRHSRAVSVTLGPSLRFEIGAKLTNLGEFGAANIFVPLNVGICQWWPLDELCAGLITLNGPSVFITPDDYVAIERTWPSSVSTRNMEHWAQLFRTDPIVVQRYDYGQHCFRFSKPLFVGCNQEKYGQATPPAYDFGRIRTPIVMFEGRIDIISTPEDIAWQKQQFAPGVLVAEVQIDLYSHMDFVWDRNAKHKTDLVDVLLRYASATMSSR